MPPSFHFIALLSASSLLGCGGRSLDYDSSRDSGPSESSGTGGVEVAADASGSAGFGDSAATGGFGGTSAEGGLEAPDVEAPDVEAPDVEAPDVGMPDTASTDAESFDATDSSDPCAACDPIADCTIDHGLGDCACPDGYEDTFSDGSMCTDIDECATDNGGCGAATLFTCTNMLGAPPLCDAKCPSGTIGVEGDPPACVAAVKSLVGGWNYACAIQFDGRALCWGENQAGQAQLPDSLAAIAFKQLAPGAYHTCGLTGDGAIVCWGEEAYGIPASEKGNAFTAVAAGEFHTCALRADGRIVCWGDSSGGSAPIELPESEADSVFISVEAGGSRTCALREDHTMFCWGNMLAVRRPFPPLN